MDTQTVEFTSEGQTVRGDLIVPAPGSPCILMSHGFEASKDGAKWSFLTPRLVDRGYTVLKFNYRGCGYGSEASDGLFENTTLSARIADYRATLDFLQDTLMSTRAVSPSLAQASVVKFPSPPRTLASKPTYFSPPHPDPKPPPKSNSPNARPPAISLSPQERGSHRRISRMGNDTTCAVPPLSWIDPP